MLGTAEIARYRRMTPEDRYRLSLELSRWCWKALDDGGTERSARVWRRIRQDHDRASARLEEAFRRLS